MAFPLAATPTYFAWALIVPALLVGLALAFAPNLMMREPQSER